MVEPCYRYRARLVRAIDGDTFDLRVDLGFRVETRALIRVRGMNAPERNTPEGVEATGFAVMVLGSAESLIVESYKDQRSFERWVADIHVDGRNLVDVMVEAGHGARVPASISTEEVTE